MAKTKKASTTNIKIHKKKPKIKRKGIVSKKKSSNLKSSKNYKKTYKGQGR
jgi:hypothetical protein